MIKNLQSNVPNIILYPLAFIGGICVLIITLLIIRKCLGYKNTLKYFIKNILGFNDVVDSISQLLSEAPNNIQNETIVKVTTSLIWRFTRISILTIFLGLLPSFFLIIQIGLINKQNNLFDNQNKIIDIQTSLISESNKKMDLQINQANDQSILFKEQNKLLENQNNNIIKQNQLIKDQNQLINTQSRPYLIINSNSIDSTIISTDNGIAFVDSILISFYKKNKINNKVTLLDTDKEGQFKIHHSNLKKEGTHKLLFHNIINQEFISEINLSENDLIKFIKVHYSNSQYINNSSTIYQRFSLEIQERLSSTTKKWVTLEEKDIIIN